MCNSREVVPVGSGLCPYFPLSVDLSTLQTDTGGRKTYVSSRVLPQRGTCIASFSCPTWLPSIHRDNERGAWAKAEPVNYVTRKESEPCNGLLNVGRTSRARLLVSVKALGSSFVVPWTVSGTLISYQNGGGSDPRPTSLSLLFFTLLYTHFLF